MTASSPSAIPVRPRRDGAAADPLDAATRTVPERTSLVDQTVEILRARVARGEWRVHLPGELALAEQLQVGRNTVRAALRILEDEHVLRTINGQPRQIVSPPRSCAAPARRAVLLMSGPVHEYTLATHQFVRLLQERLSARGWDFRVSWEPKAYLGSPEAFLRSLTRRQPNTVWMLQGSTAILQHWFQDHASRAIIVGARHADVNLPYVCSDFPAAMRHAAGLFLARGHRRLAVLVWDARLVTDIESVEAFRAAAGSADVQELFCHNSPEGVAAALRGALRLPAPPTGLLVLRAHHGALALTFLQQQGVAVPGQMSLICRDDESYLSHLWPEPVRYRWSVRQVVARLTALVESSGRGIPPRRAAQLVMPTLVGGATLARAPVP